jgi:lysophospholipase L1-like esterase
MMNMKSVAFLAMVSISLSMAHAGDANVIKRGSLDNSRIQFQTQKKGHVAFMGGSITEMNGYRPMVCEYLQKRFPDTKFAITEAGIASTCSTTGAFRLQSDVLDKGPVDLFFVEFAVNDDQDAHHTRAASIRGMEGIIRHLRKHNPKADIVITHFVNESSMEKYNKGETPLPVAAHEEVANHYQVSSSNLAKTVTTRIAAGEFDWKKFGGVHPAAFGNRIAADMIAQLLDDAWAQPLPAGVAAKDHPLPEKPLDEFNYGGGRFLDPKEVKLGEGWTNHVPDWKPLSGSKRGRFTTVPVFEATKPGASLTIDFSGSAIGAYVVAGPDAGTLEAIIDGAPPVKVNLFHHHSKGLHYPRTVMFADTLAPGKHTLLLKMSETKDPNSSGTAARVLHFVVNDGAKP